jgi:hypothetical protein
MTSVNEFFCFYDVPKRRCSANKSHLKSIDRDRLSGVTSIFSEYGRICAIVQTKDYKHSIDINVISSNGELVEKSFLKLDHEVKVDSNGTCWFSFLFKSSSQNLKSVIFHMVVSWVTNRNTLCFLFSPPFAALTKCSNACIVENKVLSNANNNNRITTFLSVQVTYVDIENQSTSIRDYLNVLRLDMRGTELCYFLLELNHTLHHHVIHEVVTGACHDIITNTLQLFGVAASHVLKAYTHLLVLKHSLVREANMDVVITISLDPKNLTETIAQRHSISLKRSHGQMKR